MLFVHLKNCFFFYFILVGVNCDQRVIVLNDFVEQNLAYFQTSFPINHRLDGTSLFDQVITDNGKYHDVRLLKIGNLGRRRDVDITQKMDLSAGRNTLEGSLIVQRATIFVGNLQLYDGNYRSLSYVNATIDIFVPSVDFKLVVSPYMDSCVLSMRINLDINDAMLQNGKEDDIKITEIFKETFVDYVNSQMQNVKITQLKGGCKGFNGLNLIKQGIQMFSTNNLGKIIDNSNIIVSATGNHHWWDWFKREL